VSGINATFDTDGDDTRIVQLVQPTQIFVNEVELRQNGFTLEDVAEWDHGADQGRHLSDRPARRRG
jgi:hypothetical protein